MTPALFFGAIVWGSICAWFLILAGWVLGSLLAGSWEFWWDAAGAFWFLMVLLCVVKWWAED